MQKQIHRHRKLKENIIPSLSCSSSATPTLGNGLLPFRAILDVTCSNVRRKQLKCDGAAFFLIKQSLRHNRMAPVKPRTLQVCLLGGRCWPHSSSRAEGLTGPSGGLLSGGPDLPQALCPSCCHPSFLPRQPLLSRALIPRVTPGSGTLFPSAAQTRRTWSWSSPAPQLQTGRL